LDILFADLSKYGVEIEDIPVFLQEYMLKNFEGAQNRIKQGMEKVYYVDEL